MSEEDRYRRFNLRIPKDVFAALQVVADAHSHSMNAEIVQRLERSLQINSHLEEIVVEELRPEEKSLISALRAVDAQTMAAVFHLVRLAAGQK